MKKIIHRLRISKFKRFAEGLLFAIISIVALILCLSISNTNSQFLVTLTFVISMVSMLMGLVSMFHKDQNQKGKCKISNYEVQSEIKIRDVA